MTRLSVNVNKIATLRNARGGHIPNLLQVSEDIVRFGAAGITVHPRPDGRHIRAADVGTLHASLSRLRKEGRDIEFNIEGYPDARFLGLLKDFPPQQATLVPDPPDVLTSQAGWDILAHKKLLQHTLSKLQQHGIRSSLFVAADVAAVEATKEVSADRIELYTGPYAVAAAKGPQAAQHALKPYLKAAQRAQQLGLGINAGHDLNLENIGPFIKAIPFVDEVSIGHALISEALYYGLQNVLGMYLERIERAVCGHS